jgi:hypothetical protein
VTDDNRDDHLGEGSHRQKRKIGCTRQVARRRNTGVHEARHGNGNTAHGIQGYKNRWIRPALNRKIARIYYYNFKFLKIHKNSENITKKLEDNLRGLVKTYFQIPTT